MKGKLLVISVVMVLVFIQGAVSMSAGKAKPSKSKGILLKSLKKMPFSEFPSFIKDKLNEKVRDFEPDRQITIEEYIEIVDEPVGYNIDLNGDKALEVVILLPDPESTMILIYKKSDEDFVLIGEFWGELLKFGPSTTKGFLDIFGREFNQDTGKQDPWQIVWDGKKYIQKAK